MSCDVRAIQHILHHQFIHAKPPSLQFFLGRIFSDGIYLSFSPPLHSPLLSLGLLIAEGQHYHL